MARKAKRVRVLEAALARTLERLERLEHAGRELLCSRPCSWTLMNEQVEAAAVDRARAAQALEEGR